MGILFGGRLMVRQRPLEPPIQVRALAPEPFCHLSQAINVKELASFESLQHQ